ncbi:MAG TPA: hypothetical protein VJ464_10330 [Blastocatellia bacterium]|nr:hypothetical protein [Blastocatellia bacterium]
MFCPQCGTSQGDELKFCKSCGANLSAVRQVVTTREAPEKFDWNKTWVAEMLLSEEEKSKRKQGREGNLYAEYLRYKEIKAGVITSFVGIGVMIFLYVLMQGIILSGQTAPGDAEILSRIWIAGLIPFFVGLALIINGVFVSKKLIEIAKRELQGTEPAKRLASPDELKSVSGDWDETGSPKPSVTEHTTRQLENSRQRE